MITTKFEVRYRYEWSSSRRKHTNVFDQSELSRLATQPDVIIEDITTVIIVTEENN